MKLIYAILEWLMNRISGVESAQEMAVRLAVAFAVLAVIVAFRGQLSRLIINVFCKLFIRKNKNMSSAFSESINKPFSYFICALGAYISTEIAVPAGEIRSLTIVVFKIVFILLTAWFCINLINSDFSVMLRGDDSKSKRTAVKFINNVLKVIIIAIAGVLLLEQLGISASRFFAALGIGGVAIAFACKDVVENMLSGFIIIYDNPFEVDDVIEVNGECGTVKDIKIRTTRLVGVDGCEKIYPNTTMANSSITNWSRMNKRAFNETLSISYSHTGDEVKSYVEGLKALVLKNEQVIPDDVRINFKEYGVHSLEIQLFFYVKAIATPDYLALKNELNTAIKDYTDSVGIDLAFETKTLYFANELNIKN